MNLDAIALMSKIGEIHADLKEDLGQMKSEIASLSGTFSTGLAATNLRVERLEKEKIRDEWKQWAERIFIVGGTISVHKILNLLGWKV